MKHAFLALSTIASLIFSSVTTAASTAPVEETECSTLLIGIESRISGTEDEIAEGVADLWMQFYEEDVMCNIPNKLALSSLFALG